MKVLSLARFLRRRRTYRTILLELSSYSDHELHDIGIDRADIHAIARALSQEATDEGRIDLPLGNTNASNSAPSHEGVPTQGKIGFVGLRHMGTAMAANFATTAHRVTAYVRRPSQMGAFIGLGLRPTVEFADPNRSCRDLCWNGVARLRAT